MIPYVTVFGFASLCYMLEHKLSDISRKWMVICLSIIFIAFSGLRWQTGTDWNSYFHFFSDGRGSEHFELGFLLLNYAVRHITSNYTIFLLLIAIFVHVSIFLCQKQLRFFSCGTILLMNAFFTPFWTRLQLAAVISLYAYTLLAAKKSRLFVFWIIIASSFHITAISALVFLLFRRRPIPVYRVFVLSALGVVMAFFSFWKNILQFIYDTADLPYAISHRLVAYLTTSASLNPNINYSMSWALSSLGFFGLLSVIFVFKKKAYYSDEFSVLSNVFVVGVFVSISAMGNFEQFRRLGAYGVCSIVLLLPLLSSQYGKNARSTYVLRLIVIIYAIFRISFNLCSYPQEFFPYQTIFSKS